MSQHNSSNKGPIASFIGFCFIAIICVACYFYFKANAASGEEAGTLVGEAMVAVGRFIYAAGKAIAAVIPSIS